MDEIVAPELNYSAPRKLDWTGIQACNIKMGNQGESLVINLEKNYLNKINRCDLAQKVCHVNDDRLGYDILSFFSDGREKYIEVKTTKKDVNYPYYLSWNELVYLAGHKKSSFLYRVSIGCETNPSRLRVYTFEEVVNAGPKALKFSVDHSN